MVGGRRVGPPDADAAARERFEADLAWLPQEARALREPTPVPVRRTASLERLQHQVRAELAGRAGATTS
jgi:nicotinate phosphoribosyltransferase